jgi:hypothetical protein
MSNEFRPEAAAPVSAAPRPAQPARPPQMPGPPTLSPSFQHLPAPGPGQAKGPDNYVGRIVAAIFTLGIYMFWWYHDQMDEPNKHFARNWAHEEDLVTAVEKFS